MAHCLINCFPDRIRHNFNSEITCITCAIYVFIERQNSHGIHFTQLANSLYIWDRNLEQILAMNHPGIRLQCDISGPEGLVNHMPTLKRTRELCLLKSVK